MRIHELKPQKSKVLSEHITKYPKIKDDFKKLEDLLSEPITGASGLNEICQIIHDTALIDTLTHQLMVKPDFIMNDVVIDWVKTNMPHAITHTEATDAYYSPLSNLNKDV